jgi:exosortase/archaeosortase family protein
MFLGRLRQSWSLIDASQRTFVSRVLIAIVIWLVVDGLVGLDVYLTGFVSELSLWMVHAGFDGGVILEYRGAVRDQFHTQQLCMVGPRSVIGIGHSCNGKEIMFLFSAFIFALPGFNWQRKWVFVLMGVMALAIANAFRVAMLYVIMRDAPEWFEIAHKNIFQMVMYVIMVVIWLMFMRRKG